MGEDSGDAGRGEGVDVGRFGLEEGESGAHVGAGGVEMAGWGLAGGKGYRGGGLPRLCRVHNTPSSCIICTYM